VEEVAVARKVVEAGVAVANEIAASAIVGPTFGLLFVSVDSVVFVCIALVWSCQSHC